MTTITTGAIAPGSVVRIPAGVMTRIVRQCLVVTQDHPLGAKLLSYSSFLHVKADQDGRIYCDVAVLPCTFRQGIMQDIIRIVEENLPPGARLVCADDLDLRCDDRTFFVRGRARTREGKVMVKSRSGGVQDLGAVHWSEKIYIALDITEERAEGPELPAVPISLATGAVQTQVADIRDQLRGKHISGVIGTWGAMMETFSFSVPDGLRADSLTDAFLGGAPRWGCNTVRAQEAMILVSALLDYLPGLKEAITEHDEEKPVDMERVHVNMLRAVRAVTQQLVLIEDNTTAHSASDAVLQVAAHALKREFNI
jgi:hypothetical protein